ncbi:MAG: hypothetical protein ACLGI3_07580, partial [Actinomycetes bacterium]
MESGRWIDGRYEPGAPVLNWAGGAPTVEREAVADTSPSPAAPAADDDAPSDGSGSHALVPAGAAAGDGTSDEDDRETGAASGRPSDAFLRMTAAVLLPLSVVAIATATTMSVGEDRAPLSAEAAPGPEWSPGMDGLPVLPGFTPRGLPTLPVEPAPGRPATDVAAQPERATPRGAPAARTTAGARRIPAPAVVNAPRRQAPAPAPAPARATTQAPPANNGPFTPTGPPVAAGGDTAAANDADPSAFDVTDTPTVQPEPVQQDPGPQTGGGG